MEWKTKNTNIKKWLRVFLVSLQGTVFPRIVSAETILFWVWPYWLWPLLTGNYSRVETIQGQKLFAEIRYVKLNLEDGVNNKKY